MLWKCLFVSTDYKGRLSTSDASVEVFKVRWDENVPGMMSDAVTHWSWVISIPQGQWQQGLGKLVVPTTEPQKG